MRIEAMIMPGSWTEMREAAVQCEASGFDSVAFPEIKGDAFIHAALLADATKRVQIRTAIAVAFPRSPMVVANASWDIHAHSGGRFGLGLGTQVKGHNERRFSVPWSAPAARMREYVGALKAIWRCYEKGERLAYEGEHYRFTLMTPEFAPRPTGLPPIAVHTAAVRPTMMRSCASVADGMRLHGFCTRRYLQEVALPSIEAGLAESGRSRNAFEVCGGGFVVTAPDETSLQPLLEMIRYRVAFYGSTRTYSPVFALHGWEDLGEELHTLSTQGKWKEMPRLVNDEVLSAFVAVATHDKLQDAIERRFGGLSDCVELGYAASPAAELRELVQDLQRIPAKFDTPPTW